MKWGEDSIFRVYVHVHMNVHVHGVYLRVRIAQILLLLGFFVEQ
jgi:hypothetical protein